MKTILHSLLMTLLLPFVAAAEEPPYTPAPENLANREWFQDAKFGLFVHWGVYSVLGVEEWVMQKNEIDKATYEKVASFFNPVEFDADEWVRMAKGAGMQYITITSKHHDGFAMFDSKHTDWDIVDRTVYGKDVLAQLAEACRKHGLRLFFYYSQLDWYQDDYYPRGWTGQYSGRPDQGDWDAYIDFMNAQLTELLTNYGPVAGIWFDGWWDRKEANWRLRETYDLIHRLQPGAMIGSNHHLAPNPGEDFQMFEKDLPGHNTAGFSGEASVGQLPLETAETMARYWGFSLQDKAYKPADELIRYLVRAAGYNSNFLLNVGPMPNGKIQPEFVATLGAIGDWTERHGESIYGTRGGPIPPQNWGVTTHKDDRVFVHVLDWQQDTLLIPNLDRPIQRVRSFPDGAALDWEATEFGTLLRLPPSSGDPDRVIEITSVGER
jgi:alpha-L-fucosidase